MSSTNSWTMERVATLRALWREGLSTPEIGERLGVTKNSVVGKVHRLNLPKRQVASKSGGGNSLDMADEELLTGLEEAETVDENVASATIEVEPKDKENDAPQGGRSRAQKKPEPVPLKGDVKHKVRDTSNIKIEINIEEFKKNLKNKKKRSGLQLENIKMSQCHWPIGDPQEEDFHFCGKSSPSDKPYCKEHMALAYTKTGK